MAKHLLLFISLITLSLSSFGQSSTNYLGVAANMTLAFPLSTMAQLEADQTLTNAITLTVRTTGNSCHVYQQLSAWTYPTSASPAYSPLYLDYSSKTSTTATSVATTTNVNTPTTLLFEQPKMTTGTSPYTFKYNLRMQSVGYNNGFSPGHYSYTILFTMTQP